MKTRNAAIDHIRIVLTMLVILHHAAIAYGGSGGWYWRQEANGSNPLLILFNATNQSYFMGFFFLFAGYYTPLAYDRKGAGQFLADRFRRLGLPLLAYFFVISPFTIALVRTADGHPLWAGWWQMFREREFEPGPLWFAEALLILALAYAAWRKFGPGPAGDLDRLPSARTVVIVAAATAVLSFLVRLAFPTGTNVVWLQLGYFVPYLVLFATGCLMAHRQLLDQVTLADARPWAITSAVLFFLLPAMIALHSGGVGSFSGGWNIYAAFYAAWDPFIGWGIMLAYLALFGRFAAQGNRLTTALAARAYGAYIVHPPVLVGLSLLARSWTAAPLVKLGVVGLGACAMSFAIAGLLLLVPGAKKIL
jgi:glucan biosynthesis protein C